MKNKSDVVVALLVILCSLVLLAALVFSISGNPFRKPHLQFSIDFENLTGVKENSAVLYAGNKVGVVDRIEHLAPGDRLLAGHTIRAHISILEDVPIPENLNIAISAESMLGEKHIALNREDDEGNLLAGGARLTSSSTGSMLDLMVPGGGAIIENIAAITESLKEFTEGLGKGTAKTDVSASLANVRKFTEDLKSILPGDDASPGLSEKLNTLAGNLNKTAEGVRVLIEGPEGAEDEGLAARGKVISGNLVEFSEELNDALAGKDGEPGLRGKLDGIADEIHLILAGGNSEQGLRNRVDSIMIKIDTLVEELNALVVWGEYITGTLAEKPSRLIFGNKANEVPTKEQIIEFLRTYNEPYPVRIRENNPEGDPALPAAETSAEGASPDSPRKRGLIFKPRSRRE